MSIKFMIFLIIGAITFLIYYGFLWVFYGLLTFHYILAVGLSYLLAVIFHFFANKNITFNNTASIKDQVWRYTCLSIVNYLIQLTIIKILFVGFLVNFYLSALIGAMATMVTGFLTMKLWIFKERKVDNC